MEFISSQVVLYPDLAEQYEELGRYSHQRLWHELTVALFTFLSNGSNKRGNNFIDLFTNFIAPVEMKLSSVKLAMLITLASNCFESPEDSLNFLLGKLGAKSKYDQTCTLCIQLDIALVRLNLNQILESKEIIDGATAQITTANSERLVFSKYYRALSRYYYVTEGLTEKFYRNSLTFLSYTPMEELSEGDKYALATEMAIAAITGRDIFNFGEVIATPILKYLRETTNDWLENLIVALNDGEVTTFNDIIKSCEGKFVANKLLVAQLTFIQKKVVILCIMNMAFERASHERTISFGEISTRTLIPPSQVEWILMEAMSLGQIRGVIDEVEQCVEISWVKPRVLNSQNIAHVQAQLNQWTENVKATLQNVEEGTSELLL